MTQAQLIKNLKMTDYGIVKFPKVAVHTSDIHAIYKDDVTGEALLKLRPVGTGDIPRIPTGAEYDSLFPKEEVKE